MESGSVTVQTLPIAPKLMCNPEGQQTLRNFELLASIIDSNPHMSFCALTIRDA